MYNTILYGESVEMYSSIERGKDLVMQCSVLSQTLVVISHLSLLVCVCVCDEDGLPDCNILTCINTDCLLNNTKINTEHTYWQPLNWQIFSNLSVVLTEYKFTI